MTIKIIDEAIPYILFQRTGYLKWGNSWMYKYLPLKFLISMESFLFKEKVKDLYSKEMESEFKTLESYLPKECFSLLDIGCGIAGVDYFLYQKTKADLYLLDKTGMQKKIYYGFEPKGSYYNSLSLARKILEINNIPSDKIHTQEVSNDFSITSPKNGFDIVISLISWGFFYPVSTYLKQVYESLSSHGVLIIDIRKGTSGKEELEVFFEVESIKDFGKYNRFACQKISKK